MSINKAIISGYVGSDAVLNQTANGQAVCNFSVAVNEYRKSGDNYTSWINCTLFNGRAEKLAQYITKGVKVCICGSLHQSRYEKNGEKRSSVNLTVGDIEFLSPKSESAADVVSGTFDGAQVSPISDDDIPF